MTELPITEASDRTTAKDRATVSEISRIMRRGLRITIAGDSETIRTAIITITPLILTMADSETVRHSHSRLHRSHREAATATAADLGKTVINNRTDS